ncbi:hypothetical protein RMR16_023420 (plasmid) [Agrobacterium sp. rho-13.3]|uniref:hypothetical protein n=1 Tax=Agrobacterium sp. rho-13.3 TaxID=3072980 RepID=UPI000DDF6FFA|nr:hypothetical protein [Agrobacterium sp. rho-13.3]MDX8310320.1 hypothetical protein [Agrobacterium sp. rho-13.3]
MANDITTLQFNENGFNTLKAEVQALVELVGHISDELTPAQRANVIKKQEAEIKTPKQIALISQTRGFDLIAGENAVRIKRKLT